jgi:hypothetical protein
VASASCSPRKASVDEEKWSFENVAPICIPKMPSLNCTANNLLRTMFALAAMRSPREMSQTRSLRRSHDLKLAIDSKVKQSKFAGSLAELKADSLVLHEHVRRY